MWLYLLYFYLQIFESSLSLSIEKIDEFKLQNNHRTSSEQEMRVGDAQRENGASDTIARRMFDKVLEEESNKCNSAIECRSAAKRRTGIASSLPKNYLGSQGFDSLSDLDTHGLTITKRFGKISPLHLLRLKYGINLAIERNLDKSFENKLSLKQFYLKSPAVNSPIQEKNTDKIVGDVKFEEVDADSTKSFSNVMEDSIRQRRNPQSFNLPSFIPDIFSPTTQKTSHSEFDFPIKLPEIKLPFDMPMGRRKRQVKTFSPFDLIGNLEMIKDLSEQQNSISLTSSNVLNSNVLQSEKFEQKCSQKMLLLLKDLVHIYVKSNFDSEEIEKILDNLRLELLDDRFKLAHPSSLMFFKDLMTDKKSITCIQFLVTEFCRNNNLCTPSKKMRQLRNNINKHISTFLSHPYRKIKTREYFDDHLKEDIENDLVLSQQITVEKLLADSGNKMRISNESSSNSHDEDSRSNNTSNQSIYKVGNDNMDLLQTINEEEGNIGDADKPPKLKPDSFESKLVRRLEKTLTATLDFFDHQNDSAFEGDGGIKSENLEHYECTCQFSKLGADFYQNSENDKSISSEEQSVIRDQESSAVTPSNEKYHPQISPVAHPNEVFKRIESISDDDVEIERDVLVEAEFFKENNNQKLVINDLEMLGVYGEGELAKNDLPSAISQNIQLRFNSHKPGIVPSDGNWQASEKKSRLMRSPYRTFYYRIPRMRRMRYPNREKENLEDLEDPDKNESQMDDEEKDEEDKEVENIPDNSPSSTTSTTTTTETTTTSTTESSPTTEDEFSSYDDDEEEECNKDILDIIFTTIKCFFNMITSAIIGIEFGANCCHQ